MALVSILGGFITNLIYVFVVPVFDAILETRRNLIKYLTDVSLLSYNIVFGVSQQNCLCTRNALSRSSVYIAFEVEFIAGSEIKHLVA